jgi:hypothetical protein
MQLIRRNIATRERDYRRVFLLIGFIGLLDTGRDYIIQLSAGYVRARTHTDTVFMVTFSLPLLGSDFND